MSNVGDGASAGTTLRYYRSTDATITTSDTAEGTDSVAGLAASGSSSHSVALTAPSTSGAWYYGACVDAAGESDTANNCSAPVTVTVYETQPPVGRRPDLIVSRVRLASPNPFDRPQFRLAATVRNDGDGASPPATLRFYRSTDAAITPSDSEVGTEGVEALAASGRRTVLSVDLIAPTTPGTHYFGACVDAVANESDTTNNCSASLEYPVPAPQRHPDLTVSKVWTIPFTPEARFVLLAEVTNEGDGPSLATTLRYYRSTDAAITTSDTMLGTYTIRWLSPSKTGLGSETLTVPSMPGTYYYGACVDAVPNESDTTNNCSSGAQVVVPGSVAPARAGGEDRSSPIR